MSRKRGSRVVHTRIDDRYIVACYTIIKQNKDVIDMSIAEAVRLTLYGLIDQLISRGYIQLPSRVDAAEFMANHMPASELVDIGDFDLDFAMNIVDRNDTDEGIPNIQAKNEIAMVAEMLTDGGGKVSGPLIRDSAEEVEEDFNLADKAPWQHEGIKPWSFWIENYKDDNIVKYAEELDSKELRCAIMVVYSRIDSSLYGTQTAQTFISQNLPVIQTYLKHGYPMEE